MAMKTVTFTLAVVLCVQLFGGCSSRHHTDCNIVLEMHAELMADCKALVEQGTRSGQDVWTSEDILPASIRKLNPQYVRLNATSVSIVIDIQLSGGFRHRGLLVVCSSKDSTFAPSKGRGWKITKLADGIYEYMEK